MRIGAEGPNSKAPEILRGRVADIDLLPCIVRISMVRTYPHPLMTESLLMVIALLHHSLHHIGAMTRVSAILTDRAPANARAKAVHRQCIR